MKLFEMTMDDMDKIKEVAKPIPLIMLQCGRSSTQRERVNAAWKSLGDEMGFDYMTVSPSQLGDSFFEAKETTK